MAHDYANRGRKQTSATRRTSASGASRRQPAKRVPRRLPWLAMLALVVVAGFGFALYKLALVQPDPDARQVNAKPQASNQAQNQTQSETKPPVTVPEPPAEKFHFYDLLPESEVVPPQVEAYKSTPKTAKSYSNYLLQAGSFKDPADADSLKARLLLEGMPNVDVQKAVSASGAIWYRVRLGPFPSRSMLNKAQDQLVRMRLQPLLIKTDQ